MKLNIVSVKLKGFIGFIKIANVYTQREREREREREKERKNQEELIKGILKIWLCMHQTFDV